MADPSVLRRQYYKYIKKSESKNFIKAQLTGNLLIWRIFNNIKKSPPEWAKKVLPMFPKEFPSMTIKISKDKIETIDIRKQKDKKKVFVIFPTGETLP